MASVTPCLDEERTDLGFLLACSKRRWCKQSHLGVHAWSDNMEALRAGWFMTDGRVEDIMFLEYELLGPFLPFL